MNDLNLARKWRPKTFEQIVGQDISIRMLKNSLFLKKFFPVYLFAGQRGCGKTSTARVFGAAVNCKNLEKFQLDPGATTLPCLECDSCAAMVNGAHPDFIEIDAASHTGVDNVRQIVESSAYMPLVGQKKIYLIDEAHMLSKAAFNAFLKLLEEPPASVIFILATTETQKIPSTVLSRCFQVVFTPIKEAPLRDHIKNICQNENVSIDETAIDLLLAETEGSARDAINLLERVRFSDTEITQATLLRVLGKISIKDLCSLFEFLLDKNPAGLLEKLQEMSFENISAQNLWDMVVQLCRALLWAKYGINDFKSSFNQNKKEILELAQKCSLNRLHAILQLLWTQEELFLKTNKKHAFLEMVLLQICEQTNIADLKEVLAAIQTRITQPINFPSTTTKAPQPVQRPVQNYTENSSQAQQVSAQAQEANPAWQTFLHSLSQVNDLLLNSILSQAIFIKFDANKKTVAIKITNNSKFFKDKIDDTKPVWLGQLAQNFTNCTGFEFIEHTLNDSSGPATPAARKPMADETPIQISRNQPQVSKFQPQKPAYSFKKPQLDLVNIQDNAKWPVANLLISYFPGKISKNS
jgi:DNA polymerase-3 subunit gamma/tau